MRHRVLRITVVAVVAGALAIGFANRDTAQAHPDPDPPHALLEVTLRLTTIKVDYDSDVHSNGDFWITSYARMHGHKPTINATGEHSVESNVVKEVDHLLYLHTICHDVRNFDLFIDVKDDDSLGETERAILKALGANWQGILAAFGLTFPVDPTQLLTVLQTALAALLDGGTDDIGTHQNSNFAPPSVPIPEKDKSNDERFKRDLRLGGSKVGELGFQITVANIGVCESDDDGDGDPVGDNPQGSARDASDIDTATVAQPSDRRVGVSIGVMQSLADLSPELIGDLQYDAMLETDDDPLTGAQTGPFAGADYTVRVSPVGPATWDAQLIKLLSDGSEVPIGPASSIAAGEDLEENFLRAQVPVSALGNPPDVRFWARSQSSMDGISDLAPDGGSASPLVLTIKYDGLIPPKILGFSPTHEEDVLAPLDGEGTGANPWEDIRVRFSEPMNRAATEAAFSISPPMVGTFAWDRNTLLFNPHGPLAYLTEHTVTIGAGATDEGGNPVDGDFDGVGGDGFSWSFFTSGPVGGTTELLVGGSDTSNGAAEGSGDSVPPYVPLAGGIAAGALAIAAGGWYVRRRWMG